MASDARRASLPKEGVSLGSADWISSKGTIFTLGAGLLLVQMYRVLLGVEVSRLYLERMAGCSDRLAAGINRVPFLEEGLHAFFRVFRTRTEDLIAVFNGHR